MDVSSAALVAGAAVLGLLVIVVGTARGRWALWLTGYAFLAAAVVLALVTGVAAP